VTEAEWLAGTEPLPLLDFLRGEIITLVDELPTQAGRDAVRAFLQGNGRRRKFGLVGCACCRGVWAALTDERSRSAVETFERFVEGRATDEQLANARWNAVAARNARRPTWTSKAEDTYIRRTAAHVVYTALAYEVTAAVEESSLVVAWLSASTALTETRASQAQMIRCVFGNPFRPASFSPEWRTDTARALARQMYDRRDFSPMPILADALQDAGCDSDDILNHCRDSTVTHVRGCWVVDLVLGKS
jgi:hypothetical protein